MIQTLKHLYHSEDLWFGEFEFLLRPLKVYHPFFTERIEHSKGLAKVAWLVVNAVTGIFAYPIFGALAGLGMLIKATGISDLRESNERAKEDLSFIEDAFNMPIYGAKRMHRVETIQEEESLIQTFVLTRENVGSSLAQIKGRIDSFSKQLRRVECSHHGRALYSSGSITVYLAVRRQKDSEKPADLDGAERSDSEEPADLHEAERNDSEEPADLDEAERNDSEEPADLHEAESSGWEEYRRGCLIQEGEIYKGGDVSLQAVHYFRIAADKGHADAQFRLGFFFAKGHWTLQLNFRQAVHWYSRAAGQNHRAAQYCLGEAYENGCGVSQDPLMAQHFYQLAADQGVKEAIVKLQRLEGTQS